MKRHLTERELIEYQFNLASDTRLKENAGHLEGCAQCREHLEQLKRKFAALDLLRQDTKISEDLISQVIEQAKQPVRTRRLAVTPVVTALLKAKKPAWIGAAAAVLLVGLLLVAHLNKQAVPRREVAKGPEPAADKMKFDVKAERALADRFDKDVAVKEMVAAAPREREAEAMDDGRRTTDDGRWMMDGEQADFWELVEGVHQLAHKARLALLDHDLGTVRQLLLRLEAIE